MSYFLKKYLFYVIFLQSQKKDARCHLLLKMQKHSLRDLKAKWSYGQKNFFNQNYATAKALALVYKFYCIILLEEFCSFLRFSSFSRSASRSADFVLWYPPKIKTINKKKSTGIIVSTNKLIIMPS